MSSACSLMVLTSQVVEMVPNRMSYSCLLLCGHPVCTRSLKILSIVPRDQSADWVAGVFADCLNFKIRAVLKQTVK